MPQPVPVNRDRLNAACDRLVAFFEELDDFFVEREEVLIQIALALIAKEHVLMTGPPGTGKSFLAQAVLGRIIDVQTGQPSVFARQFTESTVQTDLVGPINFKTLMETGRTAHFTDEGMLGSVHAFLDEVFDGRDMLLRSTLNVLQERELKQGGQTTKGQIECALMATNRYLAEVLESSQETLLAFVDRIAFIAYIPKGFASPTATSRVLQSQIAGAERRPLRAPLTVQDLDVLQAAAERVIVEPAACDELAQFLANYDAEVVKLMRADPTYVPTRYLSTRTAVRLGNVLKAACIYDYAFMDRERVLGILPADFGYLRLPMLLSGPDYGALATILKRETDQRERKQLECIRTEREAFERCREKVGEWAVTPRPVFVQGTMSNSEARVALPTLLSQPTSALVDEAKRLIEVATIASTTDDAPRRHLEAVVNELTRRAARLAYAAGASAEQPAVTIEGLTELSSLLSNAACISDAVVRWLRELALQLLEHELRFASSRVSTVLAQLTAGLSLEQTTQSSRALIERHAQLVAKRDALVAAGAQPSDGAQQAWHVAEQELLLALRTLWEGHCQRLLTGDLADGEINDLSGLLRCLETVSTEVRSQGDALRDLRFEGNLEQTVLGPAVMPFLQLTLSRLDASHRDAVSAYVEGTFLELRRMGLARVLDGQAWLGWIAESLVRALEIPRSSHEANAAGYRKLRADHGGACASFVLVDTAMRLASEGAALQRAPREAIRELLATIDAPLRRKIAEWDIDHVKAVLGLLEAWWVSLRRSADGDALTDSEEFRAFVHALHEDEVLARLGMELSIVRDLSPESGVAEAISMIDAFRQRLHDDFAGLLSHHQQGVWSYLKTNPAQRES